MLWVILYCVCVVVFTVALVISTSSYDGDFPWAFVCGILWPIALPFSAVLTAIAFSFKLKELLKQ